MAAAIRQFVRNSTVFDFDRVDYQTPKGRQIRVTDDTPFYGYVVCDPTPKVRDWLFKVKNYTRLPDGLGWVQLPSEHSVIRRGS